MYLGGVTCTRPAVRGIQETGTRNPSYKYKSIALHAKRLDYDQDAHYEILVLAVAVTKKWANLFEEARRIPHSGTQLTASTSVT